MPYPVGDKLRDGLTGVSGSGKSSLIGGSVAGRDGVVSVDQVAIRGSRRSNPATYTGLLDPIRTAFAKANGVKAALFSPNSAGACPACNGAGVIYTNLAMMVGVAVGCEACEGRRFEASVLAHTLGGRDISEVLAMSVTEAAEHFGGGGVAIPAARKILDRLVDAGKSVVVISDHQAVMAHADWIIDLGPGAGHDGGRVVFEGPPRSWWPRAPPSPAATWPRSCRSGSAHSRHARWPFPIGATGTVDTDQVGQY